MFRDPICALITLLAAVTTARSAETVPPLPASVAAAVPAWVFPINPPPQGASNANDADLPRHVKNSRVVFTESQLKNLFFAPDWFPDSHSRAPGIVLFGRKPEVYACGYCHTPTGQGRPENASLAGLPASYIVAQIAAFQSGARRSAAPAAYVPSALMMAGVQHATPAEANSAATYFARQSLTIHDRIVEAARVPRSKVAGWVYVAIPEGGDEPLGERLLEFTPDLARHELRDVGLQYRVYVPLGSRRRGKSLAAGTVSNPGKGCMSCHGDQLQGVGNVPGLAGRSPSYLLRQLVGFQTGARGEAGAQPMIDAVGSLKLGSLIDAATYAASLTPVPHPTISSGARSSQTPPTRPAWP